VGVPSGLEHALSQDQVDVASFADAEADTYVHLGAHRAVAHYFLGGALGCGCHRDGDRAA
jgi:hypothetical protein